MQSNGLGTDGKERLRLVIRNAEVAIMEQSHFLCLTWVTATARLPRADADASSTPISKNQIISCNSCGAGNSQHSVTSSCKIRKEAWRGCNREFHSSRVSWDCPTANPQGWEDGVKDLDLCNSESFGSNAHLNLGEG